MTSGEVKVALYDGTTQTASTDYHQGLGWETLSVSATMPSAPSEVTARIINDGPTTAFAYYIDSAILWSAQKRAASHYSLLLNWTTDGTTLEFPYTISESYPIRVVGTGHLSSGSADTDTMELDDPQTELLYAQAAVYLYRQILSKSPGQAQQSYLQLLAYWEEQVKRLKSSVAMSSPPVFRMAPSWGL